jgi:hypothetical protein
MKYKYCSFLDRFGKHTELFQLSLFSILKWLYSPMWTFASLMDFSQSSQLIWLFQGHILSFLTVDFFRGGVSAPRPTPNLEGQVSIIISPGDWVAQLYPQASSTHFSRLLQHAWATVGLFFSPFTTWGHYFPLLMDFLLMYACFPPNLHSFNNSLCKCNFKLSIKTCHNVFLKIKVTP